ncbi:MAG: hypothetical protein ACI4RA_07435 [Kiritimatiellia bacterium]
MKQLMIAAMLAGSMLVGAQTAAPAKACEGKAAKPAMAERQKLTPEQRKEFREKMLAARKARQAEILAKVTATLKEAGLTDEQAKATADKIEKIYAEGRRNAAAHHRRPRPAAAK